MEEEIETLEKFRHYVKKYSLNMNEKEIPLLMSEFENNPMFLENESDDLSEFILP